MASYKTGSITLENVYGKKTYEATMVECGSSTELQELIITENGTYEAPKGTGYSPVKVNVKLEGNPLQDVIDNQGGDGVPSCKYLFYNYQGTSLDSSLKFVYTSNVKYFEYMFNNCSNLISISQLDTSSATNMRNMFFGCSKLTSIPQLDTSKVTDMNSMFSYCSSLTSIPQLDTSNVTNMYSMFSSCSKLTSIPQLDTSSVTNMAYMFQNCSSLTSIPQLDTSKVTDFTNMFDYCRNLTSIGIYGFTRSITITYTALKHDAIVALLNQAGTAYNSSQRIAMGSAKLALLSDEEKAIATNKGWTLA